MISARAGCVRECRGCPERDRSYEDGLRAKEGRLREALAAESVDLSVVRAIAGADEEDRFGYRSRILLHAQRSRTGWDVGLLIPARSAREKDRVLPIPECPVQAPSANLALAAVARTFPLSEPLRFVAWNLGVLVLVLKKAVPAGSDPEVEAWAARFQAEHPGIRGLAVNYHPAAGDRVYAKNGWRTVFGEAGGVYSCLGSRYLLPTDAFSQAVAAQYERALLRARDHLFPECEAVLDLYSGIGISLDLWKRSGAREAAGFELSSSAVAAMRARGHSAWAGPCADRLPQIEETLDDWSARGLRTATFVNPSRLGLEPEVSELLRARARTLRRVAYLSCSPRTLARDLRLLSREFRAAAIQPYDFMPWAGQVEALALLEAI